MRAAALAALACAAAQAHAQPATEQMATCFACHGISGQSQMPEIPSLGGQPSFYAITQLFLFREGRRGKTVMLDAARGLTDDDLRALSAAIEKLPPPAAPAEAPTRDRFERGRAKAGEHRCGTCHGADFAGGDQVPRLANQREDYLVKSLREFKSGARLGYTAAMAEVLAGLSDDNLVDVAHYLAYLPRAAGR